MIVSSHFFVNTIYDDYHSVDLFSFCYRRLNDCLSHDAHLIQRMSPALHSGLYVAGVTCVAMVTMSVCVSDCVCIYR